MSRPWQGQLWLATDHCLILGQAGETGTHAHYPHQLLIACDGVVEAMIAGVAMRGPVLSIESGQPHAIIASERPSLTLYAEPLAFDLPALRQHFGIRADRNLRHLQLRVLG
mgnify:CR=1 FL=1